MTAETETQNTQTSDGGGLNPADLLKLLAASGMTMGGQDGPKPSDLLKGLLGSGMLNDTQSGIAELLSQAIDAEPADALPHDDVVDAIYVDAKTADELEDLRIANDTLAAALGACSLCWGGDRGCSSCQGRGRPGAARPNKRLYHELIAPAAARMEEELQRPTRERSPRRHAGRVSSVPAARHQI